MRNLLSLILVCCFGFTLAGYFPVFVVLQHQTCLEKNRLIEHGLPGENIHKIEFSQDAEINWEAPGKEFRLNGSMYDVVRKVLQKDKIIFYCINDDEEQSLFDALESLVSEQTDDEKSSKGKTVQLLSKVFSQHYISPDPESISFYATSSKVYFIYWASPHQSFSEPQSPPPDLT